MALSASSKSSFRHICACADLHTTLWHSIQPPHAPPLTYKHRRKQTYKRQTQHSAPPRATTNIPYKRHTQHSAPPRATTNIQAYTHTNIQTTHADEAGAAHHAVAQQSAPPHTTTDTHAYKHKQNDTRR